MRFIRSRLRLPPRSAVLFEDETDLLLFPPLQGGWSPRGQALEVPISGHNARRTLFGTIHLLSEHRLVLAQKLQRAVEFMPLPHRAPELNGMDQLWRRCKQTISGNLQHGAIDQHEDRCIDDVPCLPTWEAFRKAGLLSPDFSLREYLDHGG